MKEEKYIPVICGKEAAKVKVSDVVMVIKDKRKLHIVTDGKEYDFYERIEHVEPFLDSRFFCCLKGCYINLEKVVSMTDQTIYFDNGFTFGLGRQNFIKTRQRYKLYLKKTEISEKKACNCKQNSI